MQKPGISLSTCMCTCDHVTKFIMDVFMNIWNFMHINKYMFGSIDNQ